MQIIATGLHKNSISDKVWDQLYQVVQNRETVNVGLQSLAPDQAREILFVLSRHSMELFYVGEDTEGQPSLQEFYFNLMPSLRTDTPFHRLQGSEAVRHFLQMSVGLETFIENQENDFLEQTSRALNANKETIHTVGPVLNRLYQTALILFSRIRKTDQSYDYVAVARQLEELITKIFRSFGKCSLLVVGSNESTEPILETLPVRKFQDCLFLHQDQFKSHQLASRFQGKALEADELYDTLDGIQLVLRMNQDFTQAFTVDSLRAVMERRKNLPLLLVNLDTSLVPDARVNKIYNLFSYHIDDLQTRHSSEENGVRTLIENELAEFFSWFYSKDRYRFGDIIGKSDAIERILELIARISQTSITVLIQGDSGTGKELIAQAIHENSPRKDRPFIVVNCGAMPDTLLESELFGHVKGAFTGASANKKGLLEEADGGTFMLDEIGDTSPAFQVKLLRVLQQGEMRKVGSNEFQKIDVRVIAATNRRLDKLVEQNRFRHDLYYRLNVVQIDVPPLTARKEDILLLADHFMQTYAEKMKKRVIGISKKARDLFLAYPWPGNVRELENTLERAVALCVGFQITVEDLPKRIQFWQPSVETHEENELLPLKTVEEQHIRHVLQTLNWDYDRAVEVLGIGRTTLWRKIKEYGIEKNDT
jgi:transcriptional regulator with PAS, ATPase and Fis domain